MSWWYKLNVDVVDFYPHKQDAIIEAAQEHWNLQPVLCGTTLYLSGDGQVSSDGLEDVLKNIVKAIWAANGKYCTINVRSLCLEDLPWDDHCYDEETYDENRRKCT